MEKVLIILRGLQGSGKSTVAKLFDTKAICSADDYFMRGGVYEWYGMELSKAHAWCIRKCRRFMKKQAPRIVIDNTSVKSRDLVPYNDLARQFGYRVHTLIVENRHGGINSHEVPDEALKMLAEKFDIKLWNEQ
jgi:predicted kinase